MSDETEPTNPMLQAIGLRVAELRRSRGLKASELAQAAGMSQSYLWRLEAGRQNLNLITLARISNALESSMADVLMGIKADPEALEKRPFSWRDEGTRRRHHNAVSGTIKIEAGDKAAPADRDEAAHPKIAG